MKSVCHSGYAEKLSSCEDVLSVFVYFCSGHAATYNFPHFGRWCGDLNRAFILVWHCFFERRRVGRLEGCQGDISRVMVDGGACAEAVAYSAGSRSTVPVGSMGSEDHDPTCLFLYNYHAVTYGTAPGK